MEDPQDGLDSQGVQMAKDKKFIQKALSDRGDKGRLHRALGISEKNKIPASKLNAAAKKKGKVGQMARFAKTLKKMRKKK